MKLLALLVASILLIPYASPIIEHTIQPTLYVLTIEEVDKMIGALQQLKEQGYLSLATPTVVPTNEPTATTTNTPVPTNTPTLSPTSTPVVTGSYYVSTTGNDNNTGSITTPWRTIQKGVNSIKAGIYITTTKLSGIVIRNNIVYMTNTNGGITVANSSMLTAITASNNLVYGSRSCSILYPNCVQISSTYADPKFISTTDMRLQSSSPAIDTGVDINNLTTDIEGNPRTKIDIGAYEYIK